ncbi:hypothetical protein PIB30_065191 [Stylosanthes scabra]|uniref:Uncharacterized protein n=1 Tax=Stylosanthes scabra TaxID=79078 RepID=A0ABU6YKW9_9FABA|nr:hypothetical protein [Stylosanthes scabra]
MIGAGKNGPPRKYERWLSSASSGSVGLAMITDRVWRSFRTENPWVGDSHSFSPIFKSSAACLGELEVLECGLEFELVGEPKLRRFRCKVIEPSLLCIALQNWSDMFTTWLIDFGVLQFLVSERFFPYEPEGSNYCIIMHSLNQVNRVRSLAYGNDVSQ